MKCTSKCLKDNNKASHFCFNCGYVFVIFVKRLRKIIIRQIYAMGVLKEFERQICENTVFSILDYVECFNYKLTRACDLEHDNLKQNQDKMKH
jgi:hypothetical protein